MTAAVVALALVAAGLGVTAAALGIRLSGLRGDLGAARLDAAAQRRLAEQLDAACTAALEEARQLAARHGELENARRTEIDELHEIAARCADAGEIRSWLRRLTSAEAPK